VLVLTYEPMSFSMARTVSESWTLTNAKYLASKVTADMRRCQQLYGEPGDASINDYGTELALKLRDGYVATYEFGYVRASDDERILTWRYSIDSAGNLTSDDRPGRILSGVNISGATMRNRLCHSAAWFNLTAEQRSAYEKSMPFQRTARSDYGSSLGNWHSDLYYASSGTVMSRQTFKLFGT
jgi:Bacterial HORMA domain family 1